MGDASLEGTPHIIARSCDAAVISCIWALCLRHTYIPNWPSEITSGGWIALRLESLHGAGFLIKTPGALRS